MLYTVAQEGLQLRCTNKSLHTQERVRFAGVDKTYQFHPVYVFASFAWETAMPANKPTIRNLVNIFVVENKRWRPSAVKNEKRKKTLVMRHQKLWMGGKTGRNIHFQLRACPLILDDFSVILRRLR